MNIEELKNEVYRIKLQAVHGDLDEIDAAIAIMTIQSSIITMLEAEVEDKEAA